MGKLEGYAWKPISQVLTENPPPSAGLTVSEKFPGALGYWCRFFMAVTVSKMIEDAIIVQHGPLGCNGAARTFILEHYNQNFGHGFLHMPSTNMTQDQVIFGGEKNLEQTLLEVDRDYHPPLIIIHDNCCAGIIMDDIDGVVRRTQPKVKAKLLFLPSQGFSTCFADNMSMNMPYFAEIMEPPKEVRKDRVNILGTYKEVFSGCGHIKKEHKPHGDGLFTEWERRYPTDAHELARYVEALGLTVHRVLMSGRYEYVRSAPEAAVNVNNCPAWGYPLGHAMEQKFGTPMLNHAFPIGIEATKRWIYELADFTGRTNEANRFVQQEVEDLQPLWDKAKKMVKGRVALIEGVRNALCATTKALAMARYAEELGMIPYIFNLQGVFITSKEYVVNYFNSDGVNPQTLDGPYLFGFPVDITDVMAELGLGQDDVVYFPTDVYDYARAGKLDPSDSARVNTGQPFRRARHAPRYLGFRGTWAITRDLVEACDAAERHSKPTLYGRLLGDAFEFEKSAPKAH
ncbi:MAG: hypothetical protein EPO21_11010 [Chloroflexota bacterium]|nr:MAG: hypothetical protein EPO21_11010 [Chloroflexota bacterium]